MRKLVLITLAVVILVLLLRNAEAVKQVVKSASGFFKQSFDAVTSAENFK